MGISKAEGITFAPLPTPPESTEELRQECADQAVLENLSSHLAVILEGQFSAEQRTALIAATREAIAKLEDIKGESKDDPSKTIDTKSLAAMITPITEKTIGMYLMTALKKRDRSEPIMQYLGDILMHKQSLLDAFKHNKGATKNLLKLLEENDWKDLTEEELDRLENLYSSARANQEGVTDPYYLIGGQRGHGPNSRAFGRAVVRGASSTKK